MAERQGADSQGVELVRGTAAEDSTPALSPEAETSPRAAPVGDPEFTRILNHTAYLGVWSPLCSQISFRWQLSPSHAVTACFVAFVILEVCMYHKIC